MTKEEQPNGKASKIELPYNVDFELFKKMLDALKNTGNEGINTGTLLEQIGEKDNPARSYTVNMAKYLGLIDSAGQKLWLTPLGASLRYLASERRNTKFIQTLPSVYLAMINWIKYSENQKIFSFELKSKFITTYGQLSAPVILDRSIATFLRYSQEIGLVKYSGKGRGATAVLTDFGKTVLDTPVEQLGNGSHEESQQIPKAIGTSESSSSSNVNPESLQSLRYKVAPYVTLIESCAKDKNFGGGETHLTKLLIEFLAVLKRELGISEPNQPKED